MKDESLASLTSLLIDCVRRVDDICYSVDSEAIKQLIQDIDSAIGKISSLCKS